MNITVIRLVIVATSTGFVVMCKILTVVVAFFECARVNSTFLGRDSLPLVLITHEDVSNHWNGIRIGLEWNGTIQNSKITE